MKKLSKIVGGLSIFLFSFSIIFSVANATETVWRWTEISAPFAVHGAFASLDLCNTNRTTTYALEKGTCESYTITGAPIPNPDSEIINVTPQTDTSSQSSVYKLLAPIGTLVNAPDNIGDYFNIIFKIVIGLCGALAVIMIVIGGVQYMGDESVFGKTEAKSRITSAIIGLLIALGSYALLNTINPDLLGGGGVNVAQVTAEITEAPILQESIGIPAPGTAVGQCPEGIEQIQTNGVTMHLCKRISTKVKTMITIAWSNGIKLAGAAFRSNADQVKLRTTNKCPDVLTSPPSSCKPPTAIPGTSMHESGLAIDFTCDGQSIATKDNKCFIWLSQNAGPVLTNFAKEPWHWSINGK